MADLTDVAAWFSTQCSEICYPNGTGSSPITGGGKTISIGRGWPDPKTLDSVMAAGTGNAYVSIYPMPGMERNTTRYPKQWQEKSQTAAKLTLTVAAVSGGYTVTIGGSIQAGDGPVISVGGISYGYSVLGTESLISIAAALAALVPDASAIGAVITITTVAAVTGVATASGIAQMELRRQQRVFGVYVWAPDQQTRNTVAQALDSYFAGIERFTLTGDNTSARLIYHGTQESDDLQVRKIYKRVLMYQVEYATTTTTTGQTVGGINIDTTSSH